MIHTMSFLVYIWFGSLISISTIIGCDSFVYRASKTRSRDFDHRRHPKNFWSPISPSTIYRKSVFSKEIHYTNSLLSKTDDAIGDVAVESETYETSDDENTFGLYIHIPYCRQRCRYCDFAIVPIGDHRSEKKEGGDALDVETLGEKSFQNYSDVSTNQQSRREQGFRQMNDRYISAVIAELKQIAARNANKECQKVPLRSIYFGGGTPSLAPIESIEAILYYACGRDNPEAPFRLLQESQESHEEENNERNLSDDILETEITMEMDPGTFDRDYLSSLRGLGINRVSLGVQSFDNNILRAMGRTHRRADILQAIRDIAFVFGGDQKDSQTEGGGWDNVNYSIDLISGSPGLTPAKWVETLQEATAGVETKQITDSQSEVFTRRPPLLLSSLPPPKHISVYDMQIEEGTVFGNWAEKARKAAATKKEEDRSSADKCYDEDEDEDPSRQFTVALPLNDSGKASGRLSSGIDPKEKSNQEQLILRLPSEEECGFMYKYTAGYLQAKNYEHYEVSSYAALSDPAKLKTKNDKKHERQFLNPISKRSTHNQIYWEYDGQWYACGLGATSFVDKELIARPREMNDYIQWVNNGNELMSSDTSMEDESKSKSSNEDILSDLLLKRLRTIDGLDLSWLETNYGSQIVKDVLEGAKLGLDLELAERTDDNILRLTDPEGLLYSNFIISSIYAELGLT